jgi:hypothetical protein
MSEVFSFRLSDQNPREAQAREVIDAWVRQGYSLRHILTEALLLLYRQENSTQTGDFSEMIDRLSRLVDKLEGRIDIIQPVQLENAELSESFLSATKAAIKPGMRINSE